jgi:sortase A
VTEKKAEESTVAKRHPLLRRLIVPILASVIAFSGACAILYPTAAAWVTQYNQSSLLSRNISSLAPPSDEAAQRALAQAEEYNAKLSMNAVYSANKNMPTGGKSLGSDLLQMYDSTINAGDGLMGRIQIPAISLDLPVYHGTADNTLLKGIGHLEGTSLPVGGEGTHSVVTGHRGLANAEMFTNLNEVGKGDLFTISTFGRVLTYHVTQVQVVDPSDTRSLKAQAGKDLVTLVTCTPLGINTKRIFVTGERISPTPASAKKAASTNPLIPGFPWWIVLLGVLAVLDGAYLFFTVRSLRARRKAVR